MRHDVWPLFCPGWLWSLWRVPCKETVGIQGLLYPSCLLHPCFSHSTQGPASPIVSGMAAERAPWQCTVSLRHLLNLRFFSTHKLVHQRQLLGLSCDQIRQPGPRGVSVQEEGPCQGDHATSLRSRVCYSGCHLLCLRGYVPQRSFAWRPSLVSPFPR